MNPIFSNCGVFQSEAPLPMSDAKIAKLATIHEWAELSVTEAELTWEDAHRLISELGAGWRLPLISELLDAYQNGLPNGEEPFLPCAYWSASHDNLGLNPETEKWDVDKLSIVTLDFSTGAEAVCDIDAINPQGTRWNMRRARAVRTYVVAVEVALPLEEAA